MFASFYIYLNKHEIQNTIWSTQLYHMCVSNSKTTLTHQPDIFYRSKLYNIVSIDTINWTLIHTKECSEFTLDMTPFVKWASLYSSLSHSLWHQQIEIHYPFFVFNFSCKINFYFSFGEASEFHEIRQKSFSNSNISILIGENRQIKEHHNVLSILTFVK